MTLSIGGATDFLRWCKPQWCKEAMCPMAGRISKWDNRLGPRRQGGSAVDFGAGYLESHSTMATEKKHIFIFFFVMAMALAIRSYLNLSLAFLWCTFSFPADTSIKDFLCYWFWPQKRYVRRWYNPFADQVRRGLAAVCSISSWAAQDIKSHTAQTAELFSFRSWLAESFF